MQFELAGSLPIDDGRYMVRSGPAERVLVTETEGALPPARRRRRRPRKATQREQPVTVSIAVVTVIRADEPFSAENDADSWLRTMEESEVTGAVLDDAIQTLDRVRAADAASSGIPFGTPTEIASILAARIGYGDGDQVASGRYLEAVDVDARGGTGEKRREKLARNGPLARTAAVLGGREPATACEVAIPRIRFDLTNGNGAAARLAIAGAVGATISELEFAVDDEGHEQDLDRLEELVPGLEGVSGRAAEGKTQDGDVELLEEALNVAERVIRRRRILSL